MIPYDNNFTFSGSPRTSTPTICDKTRRLPCVQIVIKYAPAEL